MGRVSQHPKLFYSKEKKKLHVLPTNYVPLKNFDKIVCASELYSNIPTLSDSLLFGAHLPGMPMKGTGYLRLRPWTQRRARVVQVARETVTMVKARVAQVRRLTWCWKL